MPKGWRPCPRPGCPEPTPPSQRYCDAHMVEYEQSRGTKTERGYGADYQRLRRDWAKRVAKGQATCWRCRWAIEPGSRWHLGHDDHDRSIIRGPEHEHCNLSAAGKASHGNTLGHIPAPPPF